MSVTKPKLVQTVCEIRYERGYRYLDRCGEAMLILQELLPSETQKTWMPDEIAPSGARLKCPDLDTMVYFDSARLVVDQNPASGTDEFPRICQYVWSTIKGRFDLRDIVRVGYRSFYMVATDSIDEAEALSVKMSPFGEWVRSLNEEATACEATCVYENAERSAGYRLSLRPSFRVEAPLQIDPRLQTPPRLLAQGQREALQSQRQRRAQREKEPLAGLLIDIDHYTIRPETLDADGFIDASRKRSEEIVSELTKPGAK